MRPQQTSSGGLAYKATSTPGTSRTIDVEALVGMVSSWVDRQGTNQLRTSSGTGKHSAPNVSDSQKVGNGRGGGRGWPATKEKRPRYVDKSLRPNDIGNGCHCCINAVY